MRSAHSPSHSVALPLIAGLVLAGVAVGGTVLGVRAELDSRHTANDTVRSIVAAVDPEASVTHLEIRGIPLALREHGTVSTAYVAVTEEGSDSTWIVQNYRDGVVGRLEMILTVNLPVDPATGTEAHPEPVPDADGAYTDCGMLAGTLVRYAAFLRGGVLTVTADGTEISHLPVHSSPGTRVTSTFVSDSGVSVTLEDRDLRI